MRVEAGSGSGPRAGVAAGARAEVVAGANGRSLLVRVPCADRMRGPLPWADWLPAPAPAPFSTVPEPVALPADVSGLVVFPVVPPADLPDPVTFPVVPPAVPDTVEPAFDAPDLE
ncbi:MAG TPA: hypothetical protein VES03_08575, partial [Motilibacterales bacterium]|nr:hypothetical protein [Motilibacterales bacterium]